MNNVERFLMVYVTVPTLQEAQNIAKEIVENRLAACANIFPGMHSVYWWDGKVNFDDEISLIFKVPEEKYQELEEKVKAMHSYDCPCIVALDIVKGSKQYLKWLSDETKI